jgi:hypothetical protein
MSSVRINESPNHFIVLDAIGRGLKSFDKIAKVTRLDRAQIELIISDLIEQRLVIRTEKKGFLGRIKVELTISHTGLQLLNAKKQELGKQWQQIQQWQNNGQTQQLQGYMENNRMWIPMMLFSGIMNAMFFMSMMSMLGMAMSPAESGIVGDEGAGTSADSGESAAGADDSGAGADSGGGTDFGGDFGGGDFSF